MIKFRCPNCTQKIRVNDEGADAVINCPTCAEPIVVPAASAPEFRPLPAVAAPQFVIETAPPMTHGVVSTPLPSERAALWSHLAQALKEKLVQALMLQRRQLLDSQNAGTEQLAAIEQRLASLQDAYAAKLKTYQVRVAELERELALVEKDNDRLRQEKAALTRRVAAVEHPRPTDQPAAASSGVDLGEVGLLLRA